MSDIPKSAIPDPRTAIRFEFQGPIYRAFLEQVKRVPQARALVSQHEHLNYAELDEISSRVAGYLKHRGVGRGNTVVVFSDRNPALVAAMLGVLKAGAAFFIADAAYPAARIVDCSTLARPSLLLVCGDAAVPDEVAGAIPGVPFRLPAHKDAALRALAPYAPIVPPRDVSVDDPAYVSFTSGSTGKPKGIVTTHAPLPHFLEWHVRQHGFGPQDRFSLLSGLSHDPALRDIFTPLSIGASLHVPEQAVIFDPFQLSRWLAEHEITVMHLTPALGQIIYAGAQEGPPLNHIRYFFWGGDVLSSKLSQRIRTVAPNSTQVNFYGATETPQAMSYFVVDGEHERDSFPIGTGIADVQLLLVTSAGQLAGVEEVGEILVRTPYLSRGYLNDPEQTKARYVTNPFTNDPGDRCYKTGDLGKYLADGNVAFAGRSDHQVKIRGFRVELDEVIAKIEQQPGVARAVVLAQDLGRESKVLVAYYTCDAGRDVKSDDMQETLRNLLPVYMVPSFLVRLESFPLLPNGKINLLGLPKPAPETSRPPDESGEPQTDRERELVALWKTVLGVERVGVHDRFTDLGGDSLSAIRVLVNMRRLGVPEGVARGVLQGKTIAQIVREEQGGPISTDVPPLSAAARTSLLVNLLRGILVTVVVADHWLPGLLKRLPAGLGWLQDAVDPFFNIATPGFAFVFGLSLGFNYYPKYKSNRARVHGMLRFGLWLVGGSVLIGVLLGYAVDWAKGKPLTATDVWVAFFGPLLYYFLALATVPLWFRFIERFRWEIAACLGLMAACYVMHHVCVALLLQHEQTGFLQLARLMLVAKYDYFNMSVGTLGGTALGIWLARRQPGGRLSLRLLFGGVLAMLAGLALLYAGTRSFAALSDGTNMGLWRWLFYCGAVLVMAGFLGAAIGRYERMPPALRTVVNLGSVFGQCSLLVFVLHELVLELKALLDTTGLRESITLTVPLLLFVGVCAWVMSKIYRLYYGRVVAQPS
jgi:amino acid adenylation domain-containing protein